MIVLMVALADRIARHADALERGHRSPLYIALMRGAADSARAGGPVTEVFPNGPGPAGSVPALRLMAALHHLVLAGRAPDLARFYPSVGGSQGPARAWASAEAAIVDNLAEVRDLATRTVQTNEPGRSAALYGALLYLTDRFRCPIQLFEVGASAGLNLAPDRYRYLVRGHALGDQGSRLSFAEPWEGLPVRDPWEAHAHLSVVRRRGCDPAPLDIATHVGAMAVQSYVWPDERERLDRVRAAIEIARGEPITIDQAGAADWVQSLLTEHRRGQLTVVWQSVMQQYLDPSERRALEARMGEAGNRATREAPLAWVRLEPGDDHVSDFELTCHAWPADALITLATSGNHGPPVRWSPRIW